MGGSGSRTEEVTYIMPLLALGGFESAGLAVAAALTVVPVVPRRGTVWVQRQRRACRLLSVCLVL